MAEVDTHHSRLERPSLIHSGKMFTRAKDTRSTAVKPYII
uniref:Uncharacterized protein n=1 Tax=Picea glauca TaxID=3330 RepID=A0A101LZ51_PICGL|nr:hypothetical protein ABT39_MTgene5040 [Picea glauca]